MRFTQVMGGYICTCTSDYSFLFLGNGRAHCADIWCVVREPTDMHVERALGGGHLHVRTCATIFISQ